MATHHPTVDYQCHEIDAMHDTMVSQADYEHLLRWCSANLIG